MLLDEVTRWEYEHINVQCMEVVNKVGNVIASLRLKAFNQIYKFKDLDIFLNSQFMDNFHQLNHKDSRSDASV